MNATVEDVFLRYKRRRHRIDILNKVEDVINFQKIQARINDSDVALWKSRENKFKEKSSSHDMWNHIRQGNPTTSGQRVFSFQT